MNAARMAMLSSIILSIMVMMALLSAFIVDTYCWPPGSMCIRATWRLRFDLATGRVSPLTTFHGTPLFVDVFDQNPQALELAEIILSYGADVNVHRPGGWTALMVASSDLDDEAVNYLLRHGADPNIEDGEGKTALIVPSGEQGVLRERQKLHVLRQLLDADADPCHRDHDGRTAAEHYGMDSVAGRVIAQACQDKKKGVDAKASAPTP